MVTGFATRDDLSGNAFADRNGFDDLQHLRRQTDLGDEVKQLLFRVEPVNGAGFGTEMLEHFAQRFLPNQFARAAAFQERDNLFIQFVHTKNRNIGAGDLIGFSGRVQLRNGSCDNHVTGGGPVAVAVPAGRRRSRGRTGPGNRANNSV